MKWFSALASLRPISVLVLLGLWVPSVLKAQSGKFTVEIQAGAFSAVALVRSADTWRYHKGTNAPQAGWQTLGDAALNTEWAAGPGGFGYEDRDDATVLDDMPGRYTSLYIRQSFEVTVPVDPAQHLELVMDWDDGFIAWLDGVELARSSNVPGAAGGEPAHTAVTLAGQNHEASNGVNGNPPVVYDLGPVGLRLPAGKHVLAVMGLNAEPGSSDFSLIADLRLAGASPTPVPLPGDFIVVQTNQVIFSGANTVPGSTRVAVNGYEAAFDAANGRWTNAQTLAAGMNRFYFAALDAQGRILSATRKEVVGEWTGWSARGEVQTNTTWTSDLGVVRITDPLIVPPGVTLNIQAGVVLLFSANAGIQVRTNGALLAQGTEDHPVCFLPADGMTPWRELSALGEGATLTLRHAEVAAGPVRNLQDGTVLLEDTLLRDLQVRHLAESDHGKQFTLRRVHLNRYAQAHLDYTPILIEDCLFENSSSDAVDFKGGSDIRLLRTTWRYGTGTNTDAIDLGSNQGVVIDGCLIHDFPDKGISIAERADGTTVRNTLIYHTGNAISVYASSNNVLVHNTIAASSNALHLYERTAGEGAGHAAATNNILWGNSNAVVRANGATLALAYSTLPGAVGSGPGNRNLDPLFLDATNHDFRLAVGSPAKGTGLGGVDMGVIFPVGGLPSAPANLAALTEDATQILLEWQEDADNETGFTVQRSTDAAHWEFLAETPANTTRLADASAQYDQRYFYRVRSSNASGVSRWSNLASAIRPAPVSVVGGRLAADTTWFPAMGTVYVRSNVVVPANTTLTIQAGTLLRLTNRVSIMAEAGGRIHLEGTADKPVVLERWNGTNNWGELRAEGTNAALIIRHAEISGGQTVVFQGASGIFEDSLFHDFFQQGTTTIWNQPIVLVHFAQAIAVRRCHLKNYYESLWRNGVIDIQDSLFENSVGDALDFDAAHPGSIIRRCTFRHGNRGNVDAVDIGNDGANLSVGVTVESCLMYDFPYDKGVSIGEAARNIVVTNCLIHRCNWGVGVKDSSYAALFNNLVTECDTGFRVYEKIAGQGSGFVTNTFNNILWGNTNSIGVFNNGSIVVSYSDLQSTNWPGTGNISLDPAFIDQPQRDYRLAPNSPCLDLGRNGETMGPRLPVGAPMAPSNARIERVTLQNGNVSVWFWADSEKTHTVLRASRAEGPWTRVANIPAPSRPRLMEIPDTPAGGAQFYRLVSPMLPE